MEIQSAFNAGVQGFQNATDQANESAANIVRATTPTQEELDSQRLEQGAEAESANNPAESSANSQSVPELNQEIVNLKVAEFQAKASAEVIQTADETLGTLLDVTA